MAEHHAGNRERLDADRFGITDGIMVKITSINIDVAANGALINIHRDNKDSKGEPIYLEPEQHVVEGGKTEVMQKLADLWK